MTTSCPTLAAPATGTKPPVACHSGCRRGFTLIELMIVVAIVAILASLAVPAYTDYIRRGQLREGFTYLSDFKVKMEQYYQDHRNYGTGACADAADAPAWANFAAPGARNFTFTCTLVDAQNYRITATGSSGGASGDTYTFDNNGTKRTTRLKGAVVAMNCWAEKSGDC